MQGLLDWLISLPSAALYTVIGLAGTVENIFPPFPSDVVIAFGCFLVAQGNGTALGVFLVTWIGNVSGAMFVYALGRRYGAEPLERRLVGESAERRDAWVRSMFARFGLVALFVSRFVPGVRAVVPPFAGALRLPIFKTAFAIGSASAIWYGLITYVAFRVGADWEQLSATLRNYTRTIGLVASIVFVLGLAAWLLVRRRRQHR